MAFGREMDDGSRLIFLEQTLHRRPTTYIALNELITRISCGALEVVEIPCVSEFV